MYTSDHQERSHYADCAAAPPRPSVVFVLLNAIIPTATAAAAAPASPAVTTRAVCACRARIQTVLMKQGFYSCSIYKSTVAASSLQAVVCERL